MDFLEPMSRIEALLQNMLGADNEMLAPISANEAILQNILGANNELREPESRIEALLLQILENGGTGGNPNIVETITGTLDDPFGDYTIAELVEAISSNNATVKMAVSMGSSEGSFPISANVQFTQLYASECNISVSGGSATVPTAVFFSYVDGTGLTRADAILSGQYTSLVPQAAYITTETTIIWHPLPGE